MVNPIDYSKPWIVCPECNGEGYRVLHGHAFSAEELDEAGPEFVEDMLEGVYDTPCECCHGRRVVKQAELDEFHELQAIQRAEGMMGR